MATYTVHENRRHQRIGQRVETHAHTQDEPEEDLPGMTMNVSQGGLCLTSARQLEPGTYLELRAIVSEGHTYQLAGHVVWSKKLQFGEPYCIGIALDDDARDLSTWTAFLTSHQD